MKLSRLHLLLLIIAVLIFIRSRSFSYYSDPAVSGSNIFAASAVFPSPTQTPINPGDIIINEINWGGNNSSGSSQDEWVELLNKTNSPINLTGWVITDLGAGGSPTQHFTIPSGAIPANGYFLICGISETESRINITPDLIFTSMNLHNRGEQLVLINNTGLIIDKANQSSGPWFRGTDTAPKKSMERKTPPGDGDQISNWQDATTHTNMDASGPTDEFGTPKAPNGI